MLAKTISRNIRKRIPATALAISMILALIPFGAISAYAGETIDVDVDEKWDEPTTDGGVSAPMSCGNRCVYQNFYGMSGTVMHIYFSMMFGDDDIYVPDGDYSNVAQEYKDHSIGFLSTLPWMGNSNLRELRINSKTSFSSTFNGHLTFQPNATIFGLTNLDTSYVKDMSSMFENFSAMRSLDLSSFDTPRVTDMSRMFAGASTLEELDISALDTRHNPKMDDMFEGCTSLTRIKVGANFSSKGQFPAGWWKDEAGNYYTERDIPDYKAATYTYFGTTAPTLAQRYPSTYDLGVGKPSARLSSSTVTYTGSALSPKLIVELAGKRLVSGTDYTVAYSNNKSIGTAKAVIRGKGNYAGQTSLTFKITPKGTSLKSLKAASRSITAKWKKPASKQLKAITGYKLRYSTSKSMKSSKTKTVKASSSTGKKRTLKIGGLKSKKTYYVQVQTYAKVKGVTYASTWSSPKKAKVK